MIIEGNKCAITSHTARHKVKNMRYKIIVRYSPNYSHSCAIWNHICQIYNDNCKKSSCNHETKRLCEK